MPVLNIRCCGVLEQVCGGAESQLSLSQSPVRVDQALARLAEDNPGIRDYLPHTACAVGDAIVSRDAMLNAGDELVLLPPVSGG